MSSDSLTSCVTSTEPAPSASLRRRMSWPMMPSEMGSSPAKGSSYKISSGSSATARAKATRRAMPPESSAGYRCAAPRSPTALSLSSTRSRMMDSGSCVCSRSGKATFSNTVLSVNNAPNWNNIPRRRRKAYFSACVRLPKSLPITRTLPEIGACWPQIRRSSVVLPLPLPPMMATT